MMDTPALLRSYLEIFAEQNQMEVSVVDWTLQEEGDEKV